MVYIISLEIQPPYGGLLSSSCRGLQPSAASDVVCRISVVTEAVLGLHQMILPDKRTNGQTNNGFKRVRLIINLGRKILKISGQLLSFFFSFRTNYLQLIQVFKATLCLPLLSAVQVM